MQPVIPIGCLGPVIKQKKSINELIRDIHLESKSPVLGIHFMTRPALLISDPHLVKLVLATNFSHFSDRGVHYDDQNDPLWSNLFSMPFSQWKEIRGKSSPLFSPGKIREMLDIGNQKIQLMQDHLESVLQETNQIEVRVKEIAVLFNTSLMASIFFGFEMNAFKEPNHIFAKMGKKFFDSKSIRNIVTNMGGFLCPSILRLFKITMLSPELITYALTLMKKVIIQRTIDPDSIREDLVKMLMDMQGNKTVTDKFIQRCTAQSLIFYLGGYDTAAITISFCIHELSRSEDLLLKVRQEIDPIMQNRGGQLQLEDLQRMPFLDQCIKETMRKYPPVGLINRQCTEEFKLPGEAGLVILEGTPIIIPVYGLHMDDRYYPNPHEFKPERFAEGCADDLPWYPFGFGPRMCIGVRLAMGIVAMVVANLLYRYDFKSSKEVQFNKADFVLNDVNGVRMMVERRRK